MDVAVLEAKVLADATDQGYFSSGEGQAFRERVLSEVATDAVFQDSQNIFLAEDVASCIDPLADTETIESDRGCIDPGVGKLRGGRGG